MRLIDADALERVLDMIPCADIKNMDGQAYVLVRLSQVYNVIKNAPNIEPERKKGKWHVINNTGLAYCECGYITNGYSTYKFCHNCGADMRGNTKRKGEPIEGNNESYNCENWIP